MVNIANFLADILRWIGLILRDVLARKLHFSAQKFRRWNQSMLRNSIDLVKKQRDEHRYPNSSDPRGGIIQLYDQATDVTGQRTVPRPDNFNSSAGAWFVETAAPNHITGNRSLMSDLRPVDTYIVYTAGGAGMMVHGVGAVNTERVVIPDVWYVPGINANFVSVGQLAQLDFSTEFRRGVCSIIRGSDGSVVGKGYQGSNGLYELEFIKVPAATT
uniref:Retrovirus-related Pol polyprotein from transposon TNT 1-94-like beta-barrel domain-containing protein n=1 Tax=Oryza glumipatula TaxID=40148 RepID=A0A0D9ZEC0_9ORYZ